MGRSADGKVIVRVEVVVEGLGEAAQVTVSEPPCPPGPPAHWGGMHLRKISFPVPAQSGMPADATVYVIGGQNCIEASGTSPVVSGSYADLVWAKAFTQTGVTSSMSGLGTPPYGAVSDKPAGDGSWSFTRYKGNAVPGAYPGTKAGGTTNNSSLVVWYQFGGSYPKSEATDFYGYLAGSGAGVTLVLGSAPAVLFASFTGALKALGSVPLARSGAGWVGASAVAGGCALSLLPTDGGFALVGTGPGATFLVSGTPSDGGCTWSSEGKALGAYAGPFCVTVTE